MVSGEYQDGRADEDNCFNAADSRGRIEVPTLRGDLGRSKFRLKISNIEARKGTLSISGNEGTRMVIKQGARSVIRHGKHVSKKATHLTDRSKGGVEKVNASKRET